MKNLSKECAQLTGRKMKRDEHIFEIGRTRPNHFEYIQSN